MSGNRVNVVTVTYNSAAVVADALASVPRDYPVICVDNDSDDNTLEIVSRYHVRLIRNENSGFGRACNLAAEMADAEFLLFLNPDATIEPNTVDKLIEAAERYPDAGFFAPRIENSCGELQFREFTRIERWQKPRRNIRSVVPVGDCCTGFTDGSVFFVRRAFFREIGGFDPNIFLYYEDDDISYRLRNTRAPMIYVHAARARHRISTSSPSSVQGLMRRAREKVISEYYVRDKYGRPPYPVVDALRQFPNIIWHCATLNMRGVVSAVGKLAGIAAMLKSYRSSEKESRG